MSGDKDFRFLKFFSLTESGVSSKRKNSYSRADKERNPIDSKSSRVFFKTPLGQTSPSVNSERNKRVLFSKGIFL